MKEIRIYHSVKKNIALIVVGFLFTSLGFFMLHHNNHDVRYVVGGWLSMLFFGSGSLLVLYNLLREIVTRHPYYIITDECVYVNGVRKKWNVRFEDVERFYMMEVSKAKLIGIIYKKDIELQKLKDAGRMENTIRRFNIEISGSQEALLAERFTISPQQLCDLLNMRLTK